MNQQSAISHQQSRVPPWLWLLLLTAVLYLPGTSELPLMDRDEPKFARATVEMMQRGSWAVPYFNEGYRFDKPPLTYWWMWLHYKMLGVHELSARLHGVLATWGIACLCFNLGRRLRSTAAGWLSAVAWLTTLQVLVHGRLCVADMPLVFCVTLVLRALVELLLAPSTRFNRWHWLFYAALGLGFLAKGPIAWLLPVLSLLLLRWKYPYAWRVLHVGRGVLIMLSLVAAWGVPALLETQGQFWQVGMGEHVVQRGMTAFNGRWPLPGYYLLTAPLSLFPWIFCLPALWRALKQKWTLELSLLASWFAAPFVVFSFYATQLPHYVLPGFPALAVLLGVGLVDQVKRSWMLYSALLFPLAAAVLAPVLREHHAAVQVQRLLSQHSPRERLLGWAFTEPSLVYYTDHAWRFTSKRELAEKQLLSSKPHAVLLLRREWTLSHALHTAGPETDHSTEVDALVKLHERHTHYTLTALNVARSSKAELVLLVSP